MSSGCDALYTWFGTGTPNYVHCVTSLNTVISPLYVRWATHVTKFLFAQFFAICLLLTILQSEYSSHHTGHVLHLLHTHNITDSTQPSY